MSDCPNYVAPHSNQLGPSAGKTGPFDCTAHAAAMVADQGTCGAERFTGRSIRLATDEPVPDPQSPGLNLDQVDTALRSLTHGAVDLDVERMYPAATTIARVLGGEPAVVQYQRSALIAMGLGFGNGFGGGHASKLDGVGGLHLDDPLTKRFPITAAQATTLMASLIVGAPPHQHAIGIGRAYVAFGPDSIHSRWVAHIPGDTDGSTRRFSIYYVRDGKVISTRVGFTRGFTVNSTAPATYSWGAHPTQRLVVLTSGSWSTYQVPAGCRVAVRAVWARRIGG